MDAERVVYVLGAPGAGKGTQCELVQDRFGWRHISVGDLLRREVTSDSAVADQVRQAIEQGELVPTDIVLGLVLDAITSNEGSRKFLLDGFPRTLEQLQHFEDKVRPADLCIYLSVSEDVAKQRLLARGREDDTEEAMARRFEVFRTQTLFVVDALRADGRLQEVSAEGSVDEVFERVAAVIARLEGGVPQNQAAEPQAGAAVGEEGAQEALGGTDLAGEQACQQGLQAEASGASAAAAAGAGMAGILSAHSSRPVSAVPAASEQQLVPDGLNALSAQPSQAGSIAGTVPAAETSQGVLSGQPSQAGSIAGASAGMPEAQSSQALLSAQASQGALSAQQSQSSSIGAAFAAPEAQGSQALLSAQASSVRSAPEAQASEKPLHGEASQTGSIAGALGQQQSSQALLSGQPSEALGSRPVSAAPSVAHEQGQQLSAQPSQNGSTRPASAAAPEASQGLLSAQPSEAGSIRPASAAAAPEAQASQAMLSAQPSHSGSTAAAFDAPEVSQGLLSAQPSQSNSFGSGVRPESAASHPAGGGQQNELQQLKAQLSAIKPPLVVCGPSGVGKGTLIGKLMDQYPERFGFSVSHTTRDPRPGEVDGQHYHFSDRGSMESQVAQGLFLEHADVHGNMYGTSLRALAEVGRQGKMCVLDIDVQGAQQVKYSMVADTALFVFVAPPSEAELERRLRGRGTEAEDKVLKRLANAKAEIAKSQEPGFFHAVVINDDLNTAYYQLKLLIERLAPGTLPEVLREPPPQPQYATPPASAGPTTHQQQGAATAPQQDWGTANSAATPAGAPAAAPAAAMPAAPVSSFGVVGQAFGGLGGIMGSGAAAGTGGGGGGGRGMPVRAYMDSTVVPVLREGLKALNQARPEDPLQFLADFLVAHKRTLQVV